MAKRNANTAGDGVSDQLFSTGQLGCDGDEADVPMRRIDEAIECCGTWRKEMLGRMHAPLLVGQERSLEVDAEWTRPARLRKLGDFVCKAIERA